MIPVYRGEFGLKVRFHVPIVYGRGPGHVIEIEAGEEALYPLAKEWRIVPRAEDHTRHGSPTTRYTNEKAVRFQPVPHVLQDVAPCDVFICPRKRTYVEAKNWPHWADLTLRLRDAGLSVFAGGVADASFDVPCPKAWDYARPLDASIQAMRASKLVVAACSGLAHLAVLCGTPLLLFTYRGLVSPGPIYNSRGGFVSKENRPIPLKQYYHAANHMGSPIECIDGWEHWESVAYQVTDRVY